MSLTTRENFVKTRLAIEEKSEINEETPNDNITRSIEKI